MRTRVAVVVLIALLGATPGTYPVAQAPRSAALAKELRDLLTKQERFCVAARDPLERDHFIAVLSVPGTEMLSVIADKSPHPTQLAEKIDAGNCVEVYSDMGSNQSTSSFFVTDWSGDGLVPNDPPDLLSLGVARILFFDGKPTDRMSKEDYDKACADANERYAKLLEVLLAKAKVGGRLVDSNHRRHQ